MKQVFFLYFWRNLEGIFSTVPISDGPETEEEVLRAVRGTEFLRLHLSDDKQFTELIQIIENFS